MNDMTNKLTTALIGVAICIAATLTGCYQDKGNYDYLDNIGEPVIESIPGVTDRNNTLFCLENELIKLQPVMRFAEGTSEGDYSYEWKRYNKTPEGTYGNYKQPEVIGTSLNLEYKIAETPTEYWAVFTVSNKKTGATTSHLFQFIISPLNGLIVLDEDASGKGEIGFIRDEDIVVGGDGRIVKNHFSAVNGGKKIEKGRLLGNGVNSKRMNMYIFADDDGYVLDPGTYKLQEATYLSLFNQTVGTPTTKAPQAYHYTDANGGFEVIVNDGKIYYVAYMMVWGAAVFNSTTLTGDDYNVAPVLAGVTNAGNSPGTRAVFFDLLKNRFMNIRLWGALIVPNSTSELFNPGKIDPSFEFVTLDEGKDGSTCAIFNKKGENGQLSPYLFRVDFKSAEPVPLECSDISALTGIRDANVYAFGTRGDFMFYATDSDLYCYRFGRESETHVFSVSGGEKISGLKVYVNKDDAQYNGKILFVTTNGGGSGKVYKFKFNEMTGAITEQGTVYSGFNHIIDLMYKK